MYKRFEKEVRCHNVNCNKLFTKLIFTVDLPVNQSESSVNLTLSNLFKDFEVKVGIESKCRGCKEMDNQVFVL